MTGEVTARFNGITLFGMALFWQEAIEFFTNFIIHNMNDVCRFSRDHVVECSERTVLSCLEPACLCW